MSGIFEKGAYEYELRLGEDFGFSEEYKLFLRDQIDSYWDNQTSLISRTNKYIRYNGSIWH